MGTYRTLIAFFCLLAPSFAQQPSSNLFKVEGTVVNSATGKPLPRALVQLMGRAQLTGSEGDFSFAGVPAGSTQISVVKPGFFMPGNTEGRSPSYLEVGADTGKVLLKLAP